MKIGKDCQNKKMHQKSSKSQAYWPVETEKYAPHQRRQHIPMTNALAKIAAQTSPKTSQRELRVRMRFRRMRQRSPATSRICANTPEPFATSATKALPTGSECRLPGRRSTRRSARGFAASRHPTKSLREVRRASLGRRGVL